MAKTNGTNGTHANGNGIHTNGEGVNHKRTAWEPSYPSTSLNFLQNSQQQSSPPLESRTKLHVIVVGAGLGGLATACALARRGHHVICFEQAPALGEVGAGIQMPPNSNRILLNLGLGEFLQDKVVTPVSKRLRRWQDGAEISRTGLVPEHQQRFGAPYYVVHRAHFHDSLHKLALKYGVKVQIDSTITAYDAEAPSITLRNGEVHSADLIVAADGIKSQARKLIVGHEISPQKTGFAAYRATVDVDKMKADPDIAWIVEEPHVNLWLGDGRHVMTYPIASGKSFNMVLSHPYHESTEQQSLPEVLEEMKQNFAGWDSRLTKTISLIHTTMKWPLWNLPYVPSYVHPSSKLIIIGDAAHAMLPYMSQGAAMAVEDGAALAEALHLASSLEEIPDVLKLWNEVRGERGRQMQEASNLNGVLWHYEDGPEQEARDSAMKLQMEGQDKLNSKAGRVTSSPNQWSDGETSQWCFGYDAEKEIRRQHHLRNLASL